MKVSQKIRFISLLLLVFVGGEVSAQQVLKEDSIRQIVNQLPDTSRIGYLLEQVRIYEATPSRLVPARLLREAAVSLRDDEALADAYYHLARCFYSVDGDSLRHYVNLAVPLLVRLGRNETICRMVAWNIYQYNREQKKDAAVNEIERLRMLSREINFPEGYEIADQALADFYLNNGMKAEGEKLYVGVLEMMRKRGAPLIKQVNILRQLISQTAFQESRILYVDQLNEIISDCKEKGITSLDESTPLYDMEYNVHRYYSIIYISQKKLDEAWLHIQQAQAIVDKYNLVRGIMELPQVYMEYYANRGDVDHALKYINILDDLYTKRKLYPYLYETLSYKVWALAEKKQLQESIDTYKRMLVLKDSMYQSSFNSKLAEVRTKYEVEQLELEKQRMEAETARVNSRMMLLVIGCGVLIFVIIVLIRMVSIIQKSRQSLSLAKEKAEEADHMKSAFLANMNHEIRTPLNAIVGFSQVLVEEEDKENRREFADIIQNNNELLQRLIADVLDISKIESNSMSLIYSRHDLPSLMKEIYSMISLRMSDNVELILDDCAPFELETDRNRLSQILTNLLTNAIKHTRKGHIRFGYNIKENDILFYVEDTGEGIEKEQLDSIFDRFVQLANGRKGVGLGLAICKGLVTKMGGRIWVESEVGNGSVFYVRIPQARLS